MRRVLIPQQWVDAKVSVDREALASKVFANTPLIPLVAVTIALLTIDVRVGVTPAGSRAGLGVATGKGVVVEGPPTAGGSRRISLERSIQWPKACNNYSYKLAN